MFAEPVMFPPGRSSRATMPLATGSLIGPIETRRDVGEPGLLLNRASIFPFVGGHDARGLAAA